MPADLCFKDGDTLVHTEPGTQEGGVMVATVMSYVIHTMQNPAWAKTMLSILRRDSTEAMHEPTSCANECQSPFQATRPEHLHVVAVLTEKQNPVTKKG